MILEALKRWLRPAAPSKPDLDAIGASILEQLVASGMIPPESQVRVRRLPFPTVDLEPASSQPQAGIKPPYDDETVGWTWEMWSREQRSAGDVPGWAFCRFANRLGETDIGFVFGFVRGSFGVWQKPFEVCQGFPPKQETKLLTVITHLPSGVGIGIFAEREVAVEAAELAERCSEQWATVHHPSGLVTAIGRTQAAWEGVGIVPVPDVHAHSEQGDGHLHYIIGRSIESIEAGKPQKGALS